MREKIRNIAKFSLLFIALAIFLMNISSVSAIELDGSNPTHNLTHGQSMDDLLNLTGTFSGAGNVNITINKTLTIISQNPNSPATINGSGNSWLFNNPYGYNVRFENIKFINAQGGDGSVIRSNGGTLTFINCTFEDNTATNFGGAIYSIGSCSVTIENCTFENNTANNRGGAIRHDSSGSLAISDTFFIKNQATTWDGGAIYSTGAGSVTIENCTFENNTANEYGGAIRHDSSGLLAISDTFFIKNQATNGAGAIVSTGVCSVTIENCKFENNTAQYDGGAIFHESSGLLAISDTFFIKNQALRGGAIFIASSSANIKYTLFYGNQATIDGGAIYNYGSGVIAYNGNSLSGNSFSDSDVPCVISANVVSGSTLASLASTLPRGSYYLVINEGTTVVFTGIITFSNGVGSPNLGYTLDINTTYTMTAYEEINKVDVYATGSVIVSPFVGDYTALQLAINKANGYNQVDYTVASFAALQGALSSAVAMNNTRNANSQAEIDALTKALNDTINGLVKVSPPITSPNNNTSPNRNDSSTPPVFNYKNLEKAIKKIDNLKLLAKNYSIASWNKLKIALKNAKNLNKVRNAKSQVAIDNTTNALLKAYSNLKKRNTDLKITKVKRSGNSYIVTIKNSGKDISTKTSLFVTCGCKKYQKVANVKAIASKKTVTLKVKYFKYSQTKSHKKYFKINQDKVAMETNFKNNIFKIPKNRG